MKWWMSPLQLPDGTVRWGGTTSVVDHSEFQTIIMYVPPGSGSCPVPLALVNWGYSVDATVSNLGVISITPGTVPATNIPATFQTDKVEPEWQHILGYDG